MKKRDFRKNWEQGIAGPLPLVLYVEDNLENQKVASLSLKRKYDVRMAINARETCDFIRKSAERIEIILMDIELQESELNGIELTRLIRGNLKQPNLPGYAQDFPVLPGIPILFVTAFSDKYSTAMLLAAGGNRVISKPVDFVELQLAMTQIHLTAFKGHVSPDGIPV